MGSAPTALPFKMGALASCGVGTARTEEKVQELIRSDPSTTILVTGAMGHFGKAVVSKLLSQKEKESWTIIASDMKSGPSEPKEVWGPSAQRVQYVQLDLGVAENAPAIDSLVGR